MELLLNQYHKEIIVTYFKENKKSNTDLTLDTWSPFNDSCEENVRLFYDLVIHQSLCVWKNGKVFIGWPFPRRQPGHDLAGKQALVFWVNHHIASLCEINTWVMSVLSKPPTTIWTFQKTHFKELTFIQHDFISQCINDSVFSGDLFLPSSTFN